MNAHPDLAKSLFLNAVEIASAEERQSYLDAACGGDAALRREIEQLLWHHEHMDDFLGSPTGVPPPSAAAPAPDEVAGTRIGPYKLLQQIGEGGMGVVWMAEQQEPVRRKVALKIIKPGMDSRQVIARFEAERQALALMDHQNIARVLDAGTTDSPLAPPEGGGSGVRGYGRPFFVMELIHGVPITKYCDDNQLTPRERLELFVPVCQAIQHAHQKGVIHRDVKPSNVLVTLYDGKPVPKVIDFGVAKATEQRLTERTLFTQYGTIVGTFEYMSPEQAEMSALGVDTRSDLYSLGVLLYELLTGSTPLERQRLRDTSYPEILRLIREEEPPRPSTRLSCSETLPAVAAARKTEPVKLTNLVRGELDWIVMQCLEKDRTRRYETVNGLARDIERHLRDEPVEACPPSAGYRLRKFARRHKGALRTAAVVAAAVLLAVAALAVSTVLIWQAKEDVQQALERERQNAYRQRIALAEREWSANNLSRMQELLDECPPDLRGWEWYYLWRLRYKALPPLHHDSAVLCAVFSPDGRRIASSDQEGWVKVWNAQTGRELLKFRAHREHARTVAFSPDGRRLATASYDGTAKTWDAQTGQQLPASKRHEGVVGEAVFSPDGRYLASGGSPGASGASAVAVWDAASGDDVRTLPCPNKWVWSIAFSPDGKRLAANGMDPTIANVTVTVWDVQTGQKQFTLRHADESCVAFSPDGRLLASGGKVPNVGVVKVWDAQTGRELHNLRGHTGAAPAVAFSPDGRRLASGSQDQTVKLWDLRTGQECLTLRGHSGRVFKVAFSPDGHRLVSASGDRTVRVWDARPAEGEPDSGCLTLRGHSGAVNNVAFHPSDPSVLASAGADSTVRFWDARSGKQLRVLQVDATNLRGLVFSPRGERFAAAGQADTVRIWDTTTGQEVPPSPLACVAGGSLAFSPDGRRLALGRFSKRPLLIWDAASGELIRELPNTWTNASVAFSPDSRRLATSNADGMVRIWDVTTGKEAVSPPLQHGIGVTSVAFSPDGQRLASAGTDRTVKVWDTTTWKPVLVLSDPTGTAQGVAFAPDSRRLAWGSSDSTVKVADAIAGQILETMRGHSSWVTNVAFSPDGQQIASSSADGTVKIWKAPPIRGTAH